MLVLVGFHRRGGRLSADDFARRKGRDVDAAGVAQKHRVHGRRVDLDRHCGFINMRIEQNARMTAHGFHPFHPVGVGTHRQGQAFDLHMHQLAGLGDFVRVVGFVPFAQNAFGASGHEEGESLDHFLLQFHVRRDCAPVTDAGRDFRLDKPLRRGAGPVRPRHHGGFAQLVHLNDVGNRLYLAGLHDVAGDGNAGEDEAEESHHAPLRGPADIGTVPLQPFLPPVEIGIAAARTCHSLGRRGALRFCFEKAMLYLAVDEL